MTLQTFVSMNIVGAAGFIINCAYNNAWPSVALNVVWMGIAVYALRRNARAAKDQAVKS